MIFRCCDKLRREALGNPPALNGIDYLEVIDRALPDLDPLRQRTLLVHCLKALPAGLSRANVRIRGGERITTIAIQWAAPASPLPPALSAPSEAEVAKIVAALPDPTAVLVVRVAARGDFSTYTLRLAASATDGSVPPSFDPQLAAIDFSFKVECPSDFDCRPAGLGAAASSTAPDIDYLAKDYGSFRRLLLDRMSQLAPQWQQSSVADTGIALIELLAYVGDQLSYQQDAIATEAYLDTARRRVSLRRHALLVDYAMHDGCNARAWVHIKCDGNDVEIAKAGVRFLTQCPGVNAGIENGSKELRDAMLMSPLVFEPLRNATIEKPEADTISLHEAHNEMTFYTWSDERCCLPRGATSATLANDLSKLLAGDALLFEEVLGPRTGEPEDADPRHRHVVRLISVSGATDPVTGHGITEIAWAPEDALPFSLCVSSVTDEAHGSKYLPSVSVARGNLVLVDHGSTVEGELGSVPAPTLFLAPASGDDCSPAEPAPMPVRFRPSLPKGPLTQAATVAATGAAKATSAAGRMAFDPGAPAAKALAWSMSDVLPQITLTGTSHGKSATWQPRRSLLKRPASATEFVVEIDEDGGASLRFGDGEHGMRPDTGTDFTATYRIGNGAAGNVGAESVAHIVAAKSDIDRVSKVRNPLPASGGVDPESADSVRRNAPQAFRIQERAVTPDDYAAVAERHGGIQRAAATTRWTGSWYTQFITVDPNAGVDSAALKADLAGFVDRYRMAGQDIEFDDPQYVSLEIGLQVCVQPDYFRSDVKASLLDVFSNRDLPDGRRGFFHPDNLSFGQTIYLSALYAAAHVVPGVASARITTFQRQGINDPSYLVRGRIPLGRLEIARLDNSLNFPEHGVLRLDVNGGK